MIVPVPDGVDFKDAVLFDVICVSLHGIRNSRFKFGDNVVVSGTGPIGLAAIQILKAAGDNKIIALGTTSSKEPTIKAYGADYFINSKGARIWPERSRRSWAVKWGPTWSTSAPAT